MTSYVEKPGFVMRSVEGQVFVAVVDPLRELALIWDTAPGSGTAYTLPDGSKSTQNAYVDAVTAGMDPNAFILTAGNRYVKVSDFRTAAKLAPIATKWDPETATPTTAVGDAYLTTYAPAVQKTMGQTQASQMVGLNTSPAQANAEQSSANSRTGQASWGINELPDVSAVITAIKAANATAASINAQIDTIKTADADLSVDPKDRYVTGGTGVDGYPSFPAPDSSGYWQPPANAVDNTP